MKTITNGVKNTKCVCIRSFVYVMCSYWFRIYLKYLRIRWQNQHNDWQQIVPLQTWNTLVGQEFRSAATMAVNTFYFIRICSEIFGLFIDKMYPHPASAQFPRECECWRMHAYSIEHRTLFEWMYITVPSSSFDGKRTVLAVRIHSHKSFTRKPPTNIACTTTTTLDSTATIRFFADLPCSSSVCVRVPYVYVVLNATHS